MKVLFICTSNINRSQIAEAILKVKKPELEVISAGIKVDPQRENKLLEEADSLPVRLMRERGYDLTDSRVKQVSRQMVTDTDRVICFCNINEVPDFIRESGNIEHWSIEDPGGQSELVLNKSIDDIDKLIKDNF